MEEVVEDSFPCDCIVRRLHEVLPGTPGVRSVIPYNVVYDTQNQARKQGYWIPGVPVTAKIINIERNTKFSLTLHLINAYLYTIELEHGSFKWTVVKRNRDFAVLAARLLTHRAAERIRAPVRRAQVALDGALESVGVDIIPDSSNGRFTAKGDNQLQSKSGISESNKKVGGGFVYQLERTRDIDEKAVGTNEHEVLDTDNQRLFAIPESPSAKKESSKQPSKETTLGVKCHHLPSLRIVPDSIADPNARKEELEAWLQAVLHIPVNRNHHETAEFLEISRFSFVNELGGKHAEGMVKKRPGGNRVFIGCKQFCVRHLVPWSKRWLILKDSFVCYMHPGSEILRFVLLFDSDFGVSAGPKDTEGMRSGLIISNQQHELALKCATPLDAYKWEQAITESINGVGHIWKEPHPFASSFPVRKSQSVQWFADGREYMKHAANMMELAREEIFIADWWLSPEIYMKRPLTEGNYWRLDQILKRKAEQGVRIFILLYKEMEMALGINSVYSKKTLQNLHKNIKVLRHPDHYLASGTFFWAHHEKLVIVDQLVAFVGGIDLCYGRWDDARHRLVDLGSVKYDNRHAFNATSEFSINQGIRAVTAASSTFSPIGLEENEGPFVPTQSNDIDTVDESAKSKTSAVKKRQSFIRAITKRSKRPESVSKRQKSVAGQTVESADTDISTSHRLTLPMAMKRSLSAINRQSSHSAVPPMEMVTMNADKMTLHDALDKYKKYVESGKAEKDKRRAEKKSPPAHRKSMFSRVAKSLRPSAKKHLWKTIKEETGQYDISYLKLCDQDERNRDLGVEGGYKLWIGKDYVNFIYKDFVDLNMPFHDFIDRGVTPRMPWHDIHAVTYGSSARDLARHFIQRWNATKTEKAKDLKDYPFLLPKCYDTIKVPYVLSSNSETADVQVLRSVSKWSALINRTEESIQQAYLSLISNSKHYIYIENQFFVSMIGGTDVHNEICKVLCKRIIRAHKENENFKVYILVPLLPGFEGDVGAPGGSALQAVLHWTFLSLSRGPYSLMENLRKENIDPMKYIHIGSLRTHDLLCGKLVTELIYIHCKLMIIDDNTVIIGSANINDRSQSGNRDSEVCILVRDCQFVPSKMNGKPYQAGKFAISLRKHLMKEHLKLLPEQQSPNKPLTPHPEIDFDDPACDSFFFDTWGAIAKKNTKIYEDVFHVYPTNNAETFEELKMWTTKISMAEATPQIAEERLRDLVGSLVEFPLNFLRKVNLAPSIASKEGLVPTSVFT
uniref:Phospholipase n=1 Tax=Syphacia muris TaxID=451379 RepID=A0A158R3R6_9BILA